MECITARLGCHIVTLFFRFETRVNSSAGTVPIALRYLDIAEIRESRRDTFTHTHARFLASHSLVQLVRIFSFPREGSSFERQGSTLLAEVLVAPPASASRPSSLLISEMSGKNFGGPTRPRHESPARILAHALLARTATSLLNVGMKMFLWIN